MSTAAELNLKPLYKLAELAEATGHSTKVLRECIHKTGYTPGDLPPLRAKRGSRGAYYVTAEAAAEWINQLPDA